LIQAARLFFSFPFQDIELTNARVARRGQVFEDGRIGWRDMWLVKVAGCSEPDLRKQ
jgi:hypothetical protein